MEALLNLQHPGALSPLELRQAEVLFTLFCTSHSATRLGCCVMPNLSGQELQTQEKSPWLLFITDPAGSGHKKSLLSSS